MYLAFGIIFLICEVVMIGVIAFTTAKTAKKGGELLTKKNLFYLAPAFLLIYLLYLTAAIYAGEKLDFFYCFELIGAVFNVFKFTVNKIMWALCDRYGIFYIDFVLAYLISLATAILSVSSFFGRRIGNFFAVKSLLRHKCDVVVGNSDDSLLYLKNNKNCLVLSANISGQQYADLIKQGVPVLRCPLQAKQLARALKKGGYNIIVFRDGNYSYTKIIETFAELNVADGLKLHLEANQQEMKILKEKFITKADDNSELFVTGFSKYELMARKFVSNHPITKYIPRSFYNENFSLKSEKNINVVFIGFGKVNYQLFRMCSMQFQFARERGGKLASKPVQYHIYDNSSTALHNEFFSRILYEFNQEFVDCDFPVPEKICDLQIHRLDTNSVKAKKQFKSLVTEDSFTYFIVSLEDDLEDASYAQTVKRLLTDCDNYRIFVRAKNNNGEKLNEDNDKIIYFGEEKSLYTHANIINDDLTELAQRINLLYNTVADSPNWLKEIKADKTATAQEKGRILNQNLAEPDKRAFMLKSWSKLPYIEQESNLYHALNLPFKLNLLGFDMVKRIDDADVGITEAEFNKRYVNSGRDENYEDYSFFFKTESSNVLAYIEHSRWNALYILYDYKQMKKADITIVEKLKDGKVVREAVHKNSDLKQHACISSYYGLNELIEYKYNALYPNEPLNKSGHKGNSRLNELGKIYAYDYMDLDRLYSEIIAMGYKLVNNHDETDKK